MHILEDHMPSLSFSTNGENVNCHENYCMHIIIIIIVIKLFLVQFWNKRALANFSKITTRYACTILLVFEKLARAHLFQITLEIMRLLDWYSNTDDHFVHTQIELISKKILCVHKVV